MICCYKNLATYIKRLLRIKIQPKMIKVIALIKTISTAHSISLKALATTMLHSPQAT